MSNCNFPICLSPTEESSDESKLQPKQKTQKIPPKNKVKAKRAILTPAEATIGDLESEDKENINPFSSVLDSEIRSVEQLVAVGDGVKQARDLNVNRPLSDLEISTCVKGGKIGRKRREHVEEIGNDDGKPDNEHRRDLEDTKSVKNGKIKKNKKENVKENETGDENNDKNRIVVENKVQKLAETGVDCEKQRKSRPIKKYGRKKGKGNVDNDDKKESDEDRDSSDSFKVKINRKDLLFMNDEPAKKNENGGKRGKEKGNCNKKVKEIDGKRKEEGKQVVEKCGTIEENRCEKENAGKEECRMEIKNDNSKIDDGKMQSKTDSIKRVEEELNERKNEKRDEIEDKKINDEENGLVENKQKRMERGRIGKSSSIVLNDSKNENGSKEDGENEINFMENADKGKKRREVEKGRNNVDKLLTSQNQFMDEEKIEEVRDGHVSNDRIVHDSQIKNKDKKQDRIEKDLREDRSKKTDLDSNSCQEKNRNTDESDDDLGNTEDDDQQTDMKKLNRKKTLSLSDWSSIIENNKLDGTDPSGKVEKNKKKLGNIVIENKGEHRYKNDCYKCEVVSRRIYEPYPKSQIDWLGNSPYVSYLDRERNNEADYSFNFEMAKKRSLENYLNKVKSKKMMSDEEAQDKTRTKLSENCRITNESDKILRLTSPVLSSSEQIEARRRKRKKVPFVKYTSGGPSSPIKADCATSRRYGLLDSSFCVRDRSGCSKMSYDDDVLQNKTTENQDEIFDPDVSLSTEIEIRNEKRKLDTQKIEKRNRKLRNFESNPSFLSELESSNEKILEKKDLEEREKEQTENKETNNDSSAQSLSSENFETPPKRPNFTPTLIEAKPVCKRLSKNKKLVIRKIYGCRILEKGDRYLRSEKNNGTTTSTQQHTSGDSPMKMDLEQAANSAVEEPAPTLTVMTSKPPPAIKIKTEPDMAATAAATAATSAAANSRAAGGSSSSSSSSSCSNGSSVIGSEEISASMASASDVTPTNPWSSTKCIFCGQVLSANDDPKLLECLHAACMHCVTSRLKENPILEADGIATESIVVCPRCLVNCRESMIIDNYFLSESLTSNSTGGDGADGTESGENKMADLKCGSCPEMAAATSWCVDCAEFICDGCVQAHQRLKITKEHTIKPKEEAEPENNSVQQGVLPKSQLCSVHSQERLTLFCEACDRLTCRDCQLTSHRDHKYKFINEIAAETRTLISSLLSEVTYKRVLLKSAMKVIDDRQRLIMEKRKELVNDITQMVVKLTNTINTRGKQLVVRLNDVCDAKQVTLNEKKQALDQLSNLTDDCIEFVNNALDQGSDMALLASKTNLTSHLQRIKSRRADIPNPEIPVRISLALDKVPELIKVASSIGSIIVDGRTYPPPSGSSSNSGGTPSAGGGGGTGAGPSSLATPPATVVPPINIKTEAGQHKSHHPPAYDAVVAHQAPPPPPPPLQQAPPHGAGQGNSAMMNQNQQAQQLMSRHYTSPPQQQMSNAAAAAAYQNRTSPLQSMAQMPGQIVRSLQQQIVRNHHNQGAVSMTRVGGGPHQQQVTSSTHPGAGGVGGGAAGADGSLRSMLSLHYHQQQQQQQHMHQQQQQQLQQQQQAHHQQFMANHAMRTTSPQNQQIYVHRLGGPGGPPNVIVTASSTQPGYLPPPQGHPPHMVSAQGQHAARYPSPYQQAQSTPVRVSSKVSSPSVVHRFFDLERKISKGSTVGQQQQQQHNRPPPGSYSSAARQLVQRVQSPHSSNQLQQQQQQSHRGSPAAAAGGSSGMLSWHIPQQQQQQQQHSSSSQLSQQAAAKQAAPPPLIQLPLAADDTSFKITLKQQINSQTTPSSGTKTPLSSSSTSSSLSSSPAAAALSAAQSQPTCVTSSVPKTPSPRLSSTKASDDAEKCLDKFCQDSVNDLMMTIAKLDSHGTKVIPEGGGGGGAETNGPLVDSSTDSSAVTARPASSTGHRDNTQGNARQSQSQRESQKDDPNEDWCAVCLDGGEPVLCCDYCPKVFHIKCHIPRIPDFPDESDPWQCLLCTDMVPVSNKVAAIGVKRKASTALTSEEQKLVERILLELYCQYDPSLHFREIVSPENTSYYEVIKKPMSLEKVRQKLDPADTTVEKYTSVEDVISDIRLIFKNAYIYNSINSQVYTDAKTLEELLDQMLEKWIPTLATELMEAEEETASAIAANNEQEQEEEEEGDGEEGGEEEAEEDEEEEVEENEDNLQPPAAKRKRRSISD